MAEQAMYFHIELCSARANTGTTGSSMPGHCDHQTRETRGEIGIESRDWRCCYCGREWTEEVKPLPKIPTVFVAQPHGPFAPQTFIMNAAARPDGGT